jgi:hypothetical protein
MESKKWVAMVLAALIGGLLSFGGTILFIQNSSQMQSLLRAPQGIQGPKGDPYKFNPNYISVLTVDEFSGKPISESQVPLPWMSFTFGYDKIWFFNSTSSFNRIYWYVETSWCGILIYEGHYTLTEIKGDDSIRPIYFYFTPYSEWEDCLGGTDYFTGSGAYTLRIIANELPRRVYVGISGYPE